MAKKWKDIRRKSKNDEADKQWVERKIAELKKSGNVPSILENMADTYRARHKIYGDNYIKVSKVMMALFPNGILLDSEEDHAKFEILECIVIKLCRFTNSNMTHKDSIHDTAVYSAIMESLLE